MAMEQAVPGGLARWVSAAEPDWDAVFAEQLPRVYNFFRYRFGNAEDSEDLTALTFEKAWRARARYRRDVAGYSTWLFSIARNVAIDHARTVRPHVPLEQAADMAAGGTPEDLAARHSDAERLARLLLLLPERERELLALKYGAGLNNRAIARTTGFSESNVGTIVHRAVQTLRAQW